MTSEIWSGALLIFFARLTDVTIGTLRISMMVRGYREIAAALSFIEALLWLFATGTAIKGMDSPLKFLAFGAGFASGTLLGSTIDRWLALGSCVVRIIAPVGTPQVAEPLRKLGFEITVLNAQGEKGEARLTFGVIPKRRQQQVLETIRSINPNATVSIDAVTTARLKDYHPASHKEAFWLRRLIKK